MGRRPTTQYELTLASKRHIAGGIWVITLSGFRNEFLPGQYLSVGLYDDVDSRDYSIYSSPEQAINNGEVAILLKEVDGGTISPRLCKASLGTRFLAQGPFGVFTIRGGEESNHHRAGDRTTEILMVATGTGIAPFHSMVCSRPGMDYRLLHGVSEASADFDYQDYEPGCLVQCVSKGAVPNGAFPGRVTDYLRVHHPAPTSHCYLCGGSAMVFEAVDILTSLGVPASRIYTEVYY